MLQDHNILRLRGLATAQNIADFAKYFYNQFRRPFRVFLPIFIRNYFIHWNYESLRKLAFRLSVLIPTEWPSDSQQTCMVVLGWILNCNLWILWGSPFLFFLKWPYHIILEQMGLNRVAVLFTKTPPNMIKKKLFLPWPRSEALVMTIRQKQAAT